MQKNSATSQKESIEEIEFLEYILMLFDNNLSSLG